MRELTGFTALVTGASRGIGVYIARALAREKMQLALTARSAPELNALAAELSSQGVRAQAFVADVAEPRERRPAGGSRRPRAGAHRRARQQREESSVFHETPLADLERIIAVNLVAPMRLSRLVLPGMLERRSGHVVCVTSLAGKFGPAFQVAYGASKAGLIEFAHALRSEYLRTGVSASAVCPGFISEAGMYQRAAERTGGAKPSPLLGTSTPQAVAEAVVRVEAQPRRDRCQPWPGAAYLRHRAALSQSRRSRGALAHERRLPQGREGAPPRSGTTLEALRKGRSERPSRPLVVSFCTATAFLYTGPNASESSRHTRQARRPLA